MKLGVPFIQLPLLFDAAALRAEIAAIDDAHWRPHPQGFAGNSMLPLVAAGGDPSDEGFAGAMAPTPALQRCPYLLQVLARLGATVGRTRLMRLAGQAEVSRHADQGYYWAERVRVHVPIETQPGVRFECGDAAVHMAAGECWIFDTWRQHRVLNDGDAPRVHLVVDTVGGEGFWALVGEGRSPQVAAPGWTPQPVPPSSQPIAPPEYERINVPGVMSPWELNAHLGLLFEDALPHRNLAPMQQISAQFVRDWRALWARYGDAPDGAAQYRARLQRYLADMRTPSAPVRLKNEIAWYGALVMMVGDAALAAGQDVAAAGEYGIADRA